MPDIISVLPDNIANQIAAGEVIQRPASVIKELLENAIDAGSSSIAVNVKDAGRTLIQVIDNGIGMSETDARLAFERHATSKIKAANDLFSIRSMGFRGEALPSIASVASVNLKTRRVEDELGTEIAIMGSELKKQEVVNCPSGSNFSIKNLFFNVPARRKFLKKDATELKHIINEFQKIALANSHIAFSLFHNNTEIYNLPKSNVKQRIVNIFGRNSNQYLLNITVDTSLIKIRGFIGKPEFAKKKTGEQYFFVNNRFIKHPYFNKAVTKAYEKILPPDCIPSYFLYFEVEPETIDINIHPTKTEIKFQDEQAIWQIINAAIKETLAKHNIVPSIDFNTRGKIDIPVNKQDEDYIPPSVEIDPNFNPFDQKSNAGGQKQSFQKESAVGWEQLYEGFDNKNNFQSGTLTFQQSETDQKKDILPEVSIKFFHFKNKYIITSVKSGLMIIDQKRAHERIMFERYLASLDNANGLAQQTLYPKTIEFDAADYIVYNEIRDDLISLGFDIRDFGNNTVILHGVPAAIKDKDPEKTVEDLINKFKQTANEIKTGIKEKIALSLAQASAIGYEPLKAEEMQELFDSLFACSVPNYTVTGKPIISMLPLEEVEKRFKI